MRWRAQDTDYDLARHVEKMDHIRRNWRNSEVQRSTADELMFLLEGALRDRHDGCWPGSLA